MQKILCTTILCLLLFPLPSGAQTIRWQERSDRVFVYEITNKEAEKLLKSQPKDSLILKMLHTPRGSFSGEWKDRPKQGHFIFAEINRNKVGYRYAPVMPFQVFLFKEYGVLTLQVVDAEGNIRSDAKVNIRGRWRLSNKNINFDKTSRTYTIEDDSENLNRLLIVELDKFRAIFNLSKHLVNPWHGGYDYRGNGPSFYSYMITDKNKYKPGETVRFKSYALSGSRRPLKSELDIWMQADKYNSFKKISVLSPYHPGGYAGEVLLHDSLKLRLDNHYALQLRDKKGKIVASTRFKQEDYELSDSRIETRLTMNNHYAPDTNAIEIKALDANGLFLQDMQAEILVKRDAVLASLTDVLVLPDTLMYQKIDLGNDKPTWVNIPPDLFGESNCRYSVAVKALTYDNQRLESRQSATFYKSKYEISSSTRNDTICFQWKELGREKPVTAELRYDDAKEAKRIELPYEEPFNQAVKSYDFRIDSLSYRQSFETARLHAHLNIAGGIAADSFHVKLINPLNLELSWYIYQGNTLLEKGSGKEFDFQYPNTDLEVTHYVEIFYFMGGTEQAYRRTFVPKTEFLDVAIDLPNRIYPGQSLETTVTVKNHLGKPVKDVDLTAFAYNSQLDHSVPDLPYYGESPRTREQRSSYSLDEKKYMLNVSLDYFYWNKQAQLDTMKYYQFTYPWNKRFRYTVDTPDSTTQFAPYVMKNSEAVAIYVIEVNGKPVYFSWTNQPKAYSFLVSDTVKQQITLRLHDRAIVLDSILFESGKKTILSLDMDHLPPKVKTIRLDTRDKNGNYHFTPTEKTSYQRYISRIPVSKLYNYTYLKQGDTIHPVFHQCFQSNRSEVLTGPLPQGFMSYNEGVKYRHEGGFSYRYEDNVVYKYPLETCPETIRFSSTNPINNLNDFALTSKVFNQAIKDCRLEAPWYPKNILISQSDMNLNFKLPEQPDTIGVSNLLLRDVKTNQILYPNRLVGSERRYSHIPPATYDVIALYDNGKFIRFDSLTLKSHAYTEVNMARLPLQEKDSLSTQWLTLRTKFLPDYTDKPSTTNRRSYSERFIGQSLNKWNSVRGTVKDETGEPLIDVAVFLKGTRYGTVSNLDGYFEIAVDDNESVLVFSYIGCKTKEEFVLMGSEIIVTLEEKAQMLTEFIRIGYGSMEKHRVSSYVFRTNDASQSPPDKVDDASEAEIQAAEDNLYNELLQLNGLRSNFSDVGFWEPRLYTDKLGKAQFTVTFPDNITQWNAVVYAMNRKLNTGTARKNIQSYKPLMAELKSPLFLIVGDLAYYAGNIRNYTRDKEIEGNVIFTLGQDTTLNTAVRFTSSHQEKMQVAPQTTDSLTANFLFQRDDGYQDGEERTIPVFPQGTEIADGTLDFLKNGDQKEITGNEGEEIRVTLSENPLDMYVDAAYSLQNYRYDCNEQLASKLIGLLNSKLYQQYAEQPFKHDKRVNEIINHLVKNRNDGQLWSWWGNSSATNYWMSAHVIRALNLAQQAGYTVNLNLTTIEEDYMDMRRYRNSSLQDIEILHALSESGTKQNYEAAVNRFEKQIARLEFVADSIARKQKIKNTTSYLKEKLLLLEIRQRQNTGYSSDSLLKYL
ncbi:MAG: carboxypeptidase-like regulatory domain-containing protein, partial [Prevotellaceae bacterium]|nr:carboxypeptidase-like regulatory domain-containing protein [Prevotellaceae bacterium]